MNQPNQRIYEFQALVERFGGIGSSYFLEFPFSVEEEFGTKGLVRICGSLNGVPIERSLMPRGNGTHMFLLSHLLCKKARLTEGQTANVMLQQDHRIREAIIPEELEAAFDMEPEARSAFENISPGKQRDICTYINEAKRPETRDQRTLMMLNRLLTGYFKPAVKKVKPTAES